MMHDHKPTCVYIEGESVFYFMSRARRMLQLNGLSSLSDEMTSRALKSSSQNQAKSIISEYVDILSVNVSH